MNKEQYYKTKEQKREYKGERYFRFNRYSEKTVQVCLSTGQTKLGKANTFGITVIHRLSFLTNYLGMKYVEPCTKEEYYEKFDEAIKMLK